MKLDLTTRVKTLDGGYILRSDLTQDELQEYVTENELDGAINAGDFPKDFHMNYEYVLSMALSHYNPDLRTDAMQVNVLATKIIGEEEAELNDKLSDLLVRVLEQVTTREEDEDSERKRLSFKWWVTAPIIKEIEDSENDV